MSNETPPAALWGWPWNLQWPSLGLPGTGLAPQQLWQPINPGWTFGNVIIDNSNSSAPEVERNVVSRHSYGRQIGRLMDAVELLVKALPKATAQDPRVQDFLQLAESVREIKREGRAERLTRLREELEALKAEDRPAWEQLVRPR